MIFLHHSPDLLPVRSEADCRERQLVYEHFPARRLEKAEHYLDQCSLATTRRTHDRYEFSWLNDEAYSLKHVRLGFCIPVTDIPQFKLSMDGSRVAKTVVMAFLQRSKCNVG